MEGKSINSPLLESGDTVLHSHLRSTSGIHSDGTLPLPTAVPKCGRFWKILVLLSGHQFVFIFFIYYVDGESAPF